jgi:methionyl-tRNA formyltransferase
MTQRMRILFLGDGEWAGESLRRLHLDGHIIAGVVLRARPTSPSLAEAAAWVKAPVFQPEHPSSQEFVAEAVALAPELMVSVAYDRILRRPLLTLPSAGCINFHAGKLPRYRGRNVVNWAIINGEEEIGLTAHYMDEGIDSGAILLQRTLPITWTDTYADVLGNVVRAMPDLVSTTVRGLAEGNLIPQPQATEQGTYYGGRVPGDEWLDWSETSRDLYNKIRGITRPGPGARTLLGSEPVVIWKAEYDPDWPRYRATPGEVVGRSTSGVRVKTGDSTLQIREVQVGEGPAEPPTWRLGTRLGDNAGVALVRLVERLAELERRLEQGRYA